jgi:myo-inositol-1(or 4)-monophosphatase
MAESRLSAVAEIALITGKELLAIFNEGKYSGEMKSDHTLVTEADRQADNLIQDFIMKRFPGEGVLSEESSTVYPGTEHVWVIDPLDGTVNYSQRLHYWGVSIAHLVNGIPQNGAVYMPMIDEMYTASRGEGAYLNGKPLTIKKDLSKELFPLFVHCSRMLQRYSVSIRYKKRSLGAAAYHLCLVANNTAILALESTPRIWDFAAGWLIIEESGAAIQSLGKEQPFPAQPGINYAKKPYSILAARSAEILVEAERGIKLIAG